jgi:S-adenosylmethionine hydrolase
MARPIITLTTDFVLADGFVGSMKGVIASIAPEANVVNITHDVPPPQRRPLWRLRARHHLPLLPR